MVVVTNTLAMKIARPINSLCGRKAVTPLTSRLATRLRTHGRVNVTVAAKSSGQEGRGSDQQPADYLRPERLAMGAAWVGFFSFAAFVAPSGDAVAAWDIDFVKTLISTPFSGAVNPLLEAQFNMLGVMPAVYASVLLPGAKGQKPLPAAPFLVLSFALGYGALAPYLVARQQREEPVARSSLGWYARTIAESKINAVALIGFAAYLIYYGAVNLSPETLNEYANIWANKSALCAASSVDLAILSTVMLNPMREDCRRRGWAAGRALPFCLLPVLGPAVYLLLRPQLPEE